MKTPDFITTDIWGAVRTRLFEAGRNRLHLHLILLSLIAVCVTLLIALHFGLLNDFLSKRPITKEWSGFVTVLSLIVCGSVLFLSAATWRPHDSSAPKEVRQRGAKVKVHVMLPLRGSARGDGLLQAAGFLAGRDVSVDLVDVQFHDHENRSDVAVGILRRIVNQCILDPDPICIICTMSDVSEDVAREFREAVASKPGLLSRSSLLLTVCSAADVPHDPANHIFRFFISGKDEAEKIVEFCGEHGADASPTFIVPLSAKYSREISGIVSSKLIEGGKPLIVLPDERVEALFPKVWLDEHPGYGAPDLRHQTAVMVGYDVQLFEALARFKRAGFCGRVVSTTTLSVPDWIQYLKTKKIVDSRLHVTGISMGSFDGDEAHRFCDAMRVWEFSTVTGCLAVYGKDAGTPARAMFTPLEKEVYQNINPNYISAFCFDAIRLFAGMLKQQKSSLSEVDWGIALIDDRGPLSMAHLTKDKEFFPHLVLASI